MGGRGEGKEWKSFLESAKKFTHQHGILPQKYSPETVAMAVCWPKFSTLLNSAGDVGRYLSCQQFLSYWDHFIKHNSTPSVSTRIVNSDLNLVRHDICPKKITTGKMSVLIIPGKCCFMEKFTQLTKKFTLPPVVLVVTYLTFEYGENYNLLGIRY